MINDIKDKIDILTFPDDVEDPRVQEISTNNELLFRVALYGPEEQYPLDALKNKAIDIVNNMEGKDGIVDITLG
jgi:multidrug efflux pump subunit AcrB